MTNTKNIKRRIKSISSTLQVTKALELISSIKMRQSVSATLSAQDFALNITRMVNELASGQEQRDILRNIWPYQINQSDKILLIIIASDRGLAGPLNTNIAHQTHNTTAQYPNYRFDAICVGKKAPKATRTIANIQIINLFEHNQTTYDFFLASPITKIAIDGFRHRKYARVLAIYTDFVNTLKQIPKTTQILPVEPEREITDHNLPNTPSAKEPGSKGNTIDYVIEPDKLHILEILGRLTARVNIYQALLESTASEHAARMVAMKNATENGRELVKDLSFAFNKLRQQSITQEIAEISAGRAALQISGS